MSDTLQEREDQIANEEADERTFQRIRRARLIGNPNQNADWCDDCHGYTHMPYCPSSESAKEVSAHQPAARGGGDAARFRISTHQNGYYCVSIPNYHGGEVVKAEEYERLRAAIEVAINNLNAGSDPKFLTDYLRLTLDQQRSTSG